MLQILFSLSIATILLVGHHLLLTLVYLPVLAKENSGGIILSTLSKRSRNWMYTSLVIFMVTGIYLMIVDPNYLGVRKFRKPVGIVMLVKYSLNQKDTGCAPVSF